MKADTTSDALFSQVDLFASLAALTGQKLDERAAPDSFNRLDTMLGQSRQGRPYLIEQAGSLAVIEGDWKFIAPSQGPKMNQNTNTELGNDPQPQLYNLRRDPGERHNLATSQPDKVKSLTVLLKQVQTQARTRQ